MNKYQIGDKLRIREWDDMASEFGVSNGNINKSIPFTLNMAYLCGQNFTVSDIKYGAYFSEEKIENTRPDSLRWNISDYMLEPRNMEELYVASDAEINELLYLK